MHLAWHSIGVAVLSVSLLVLSPGALASRTGPCADDARRLCPGLGGQALSDCLKKKEAERSPECRAQKERARNLLEECRQEINKFCEEIKPGKGRVHACLKRHEAQLGQGCREAVKSISAPRSGSAPQG